MDETPTKIQTVFLDQLHDRGVFNEIHNTYRRRLFRKRELVKREHVGVWGWNTWCGVHTLPLLTGPGIHAILKRTFQVGLDRPEAGTGLLPHAVIHQDGKFASRVEMMCYGGIHSESYCLDNILCWGKMAMEYALVTGDRAWFTPELFKIVTRSLDYILTHLREKYNPALVYAGIEGDWTECTDWEADNSNVTANVLRSLQLAQECQKYVGESCTKLDYATLYAEILTNFNKPVQEGGFWDPHQGYYIHGNDGKGTRIYGNLYFESTVNYFALLWDLVPADRVEKLWAYIRTHQAEIEQPYPVLTNWKPRTAARRPRYGKTVTNGDIWMVLGAHAAAARLQAGYIAEGTRMFRTIVKYEAEEGVLHNCIFQDGSVNDSWDPEIANYGALYAPYVLGLLGIRPKAQGIEFHIRALEGLSHLTTKLFFNQIPFKLKVAWNDSQTPRLTEVVISRNNGKTGEKNEELKTDNLNFLLTRDWKIQPLI